MSSSMYDDMDGMLEQLRAQQAKMNEAQQELESAGNTVKSKDRMVTATVDYQGKLVELKLSGSRYRSLAPAELCDRIVQTIRKAQDEALRKTMSTFLSFTPDGLLPDAESLMSGSFDIEQMLADTMKSFESTGDYPQPGATQTSEEEKR